MTGFLQEFSGDLSPEEAAIRAEEKKRKRKRKKEKEKRKYEEGEETSDRKRKKGEKSSRSTSGKEESRSSRRKKRKVSSFLEIGRKLDEMLDQICCTSIKGDFFRFYQSKAKYIVKTKKQEIQNFRE